MSEGQRYSELRHISEKSVDGVGNRLFTNGFRRCVIRLCE